MILTDEEREALGHRIAWRYKKSSDPSHSDTYTFNRACLMHFADAIERAVLRKLREAGPVGEAGSMPGSNGFTVACFKASNVPVGTPLFTIPEDQT